MAKKHNRFSKKAAKFLAVITDDNNPALLPAATDPKPEAEEKPPEKLPLFLPKKIEVLEAATPAEMPPPTETPKKKKAVIVKKPRSEKRERGQIIGVRVSPAEYEAIATAADVAGLSLASYIRGLVLESPETQKTRKPSFDRVLLAQLIAQVGKIGSNLNQIARRLNQGKGVGFERIGGALDEVAAISAAALEALKGLR